MTRGERAFVFAMAFVIGFMIAGVIAVVALGHYQPGSHNAIHAIQQTWCGKANRECHEGNNAIRVAKCESAQYWKKEPQNAVNGQYKGMFQQGRWARGEYGHGPSVWDQARAAYRNWRANGWQPQWECAIKLGIR